MTPAEFRAARGEAEERARGEKAEADARGWRTTNDAAIAECERLRHTHEAQRVRLVEHNNELLIRARDAERERDEAVSMIDALKTEMGRAMFATMNGWPLPEEMAAVRSALDASEVALAETREILRIARSENVRLKGGLAAAKRLLANQQALIESYSIEAELRGKVPSAALGVAQRERDEARAEVAKLRDAIRRAGFCVMQTSGEWSIHDVSELEKKELERTNQVIDENIDLALALKEKTEECNLQKQRHQAAELEVARLTKECERLKSDVERLRKRTHEIADDVHRRVAEVRKDFTPELMNARMDAETRKEVHKWLKARGADPEAAREFLPDGRPIYFQSLSHYTATAIHELLRQLDQSKEECERLKSEAEETHNVLMSTRLLAAEKSKEWRILLAQILRLDPETAHLDALLPMVQERITSLEAELATAVRYRVTVANAALQQQRKDEQRFNAVAMRATKVEERLDLAEKLAEATQELLKCAEQQECHHEETHRGGVLWTICNNCDRKWADDDGGFQPYVEPVEITAAREALDAFVSSGKQETQETCTDRDCPGESACGKPESDCGAPAIGNTTAEAERETLAKARALGVKITHRPEAPAQRCGEWPSTRTT